MRKIYLALIVTAAFSSQSVLAADDHSMGKMKNKSCTTIAKACQSAGFEKKGNQGMKFWFDCMKPVMMGKTVKGVKIDAEVVKDCRTAKISEMKAELQDLESVN